MGKLAGVLILGLVASGVAQAEDWPHWRGPDGRRISNERGLPTSWSRDTVVWRTPLRGLGVSSPIVSGDLVFLTSQIGRGPLRPGGHPALVRGGPDPDSERPLGGQRVPGSGADIAFLVSAFNRADGSVAWEYEIEAEGHLPGVHQKHNMASPSPVADGEHVYVWFATGQLVALDLRGELAWRRSLARDYGPFEIVWGHSSSPTIYDDLLILQCDHECHRDNRAGLHVDGMLGFVRQSRVRICSRLIGARGKSAGKSIVVRGCGRSARPSWWPGPPATS